jgi:GNAT superfamily N-acetyltransferase
VSALIQAYIRRNAATGRDTERIGPFLATFSRHSANPFLSYAIPDEHARPTDAAVAALVAAFHRRQRRPRLEYLPSLARSVETVLVRAGFTVEGRLPVLACPPGAEVPQPAPAGFRLAAPDSDDDLYDLLAVQHEAYREPAPPTDADVARLRRLVEGGGLAALAREAGTGAAAGAGVCDYIHDGVGELAGFAVRQAYRRRGVAAAITWWLTAAAHRAGAPGVFLTPAGEAEERIYARVGYRRVEEILHISLG